MAADNERLEQGFAIREEVLGKEYVELARSRVTEFSKPLQEFVTEYAWGEVWSRPGMDLRTRSLVTIAMLCAANRPQEIELHVTGALRNGCTPEEIREVLFQLVVYCGVPAAFDATITINRLLAEGLEDKES